MTLHMRCLFSLLVARCYVCVLYWALLRIDSSSIVHMTCHLCLLVRHCGMRVYDLGFFVGYLWLFCGVLYVCWRYCGMCV